MNTLYLALRISTAGDGKKSTPAIKVAIAAVALSVAVMLAAIAIVLGFKEEITRKVLGYNPHIVLKVNPPLSNDEYLVEYSEPLYHLLSDVPYIENFSLTARAPAIFKTDKDFKGVYLSSLGDKNMREFIESQLIEGKMPDFNKDTLGVLISQIAADQLQIKVGETLPTYFIPKEVHIKPMKVAGIFNTHFSRYDDTAAFGSLSFIQNMSEISPNQGTQIYISVDDFDKVDQYAQDLRQRLSKAYSEGILTQYYDIDTALSSGASYFSWLSLLDTNVVVILALMTAVALITLISGMLILIVDKKRFIAIMKALGASNRLLRNVFIWLTLRVAFTGLVIGNAIMLTFLLLQEHFHFIPLKAESYYIDFVPVKLTFWSIIILNVAILIITYLMLLLPARFVGTIKGTPNQ